MRLNPFLLIGLLAGVPATALADAPMPAAPEADEPTTIEVAQVVSPTTVDGSGPESEVADDADVGFTLPFTTSLSVDTSTTMGNLLRHRSSACNTDSAWDDPEAENCNVTTAVQQLYTLGFTYVVPARVTLMTGFDTGYSKNLTRVGGANEIYEQRWQDSSIWALAPGFYSIPVVDINMTANASVRLPTSRFSDHQALQSAVSGGLTLAHTWGDFTFSVRSGYGYNFYRFTGNTVDVSQLGFEPVHRDDEFAAQDVLTTGGLLTQHRFTNTINLSYSWLDAFATVVSFTRSDGWAYNDAVEAAEADPDTLPDAAHLTRHRDIVVGTVAQSYMVAPFLTLTGILRTVQQPLSADNTRVRFPFWDTETGDISNTSFFVNLTATY